MENTYVASTCRCSTDRARLRSALQELEYMYVCMYVCIMIENQEKKKSHKPYSELNNKHLTEND